MVQLAERFGLPDDGECLTDQYHDYQLSPMVDLPEYDVVKPDSTDSGFQNLEKDKLPNGK